MPSAPPTIAPLASRFFEGNDPLVLVADTGQLLWWNRSCEQLFPWLAQRAAPEASEMFGDAWRDVIETVHYQIMTVEVPDSGSYTGIVIDSRTDMLEQANFLVAFKPAGDRALHARESKEFLSVVAHDLKNPLSALFGYADVLLDTPAGDGLSEAQRTIALRIRQIARRSIEFVRNCEYLSLAPLREGALPVFHTDVNEVVRTVIDNLIRDGDQTPTIELELAAQSVRTSAHPTHIERVASNLISNALKYTPLTGKIVIRTMLEKGIPTLAVHNSGAAIPVSEQQNIFERHTRGSTSVGTPGSGLGLYIVKKVVRTVGGSIELDSVEGRGTTFTVTLPRGN